MHRRLSHVVGIAAAIAFVLTAWSTTSAAKNSAARSAASSARSLAASSTTLPLPRRNGVTLTVATVNNPDMVTVESLTSKFTQQTGINVKYVTLPEDQLRDKVTTDVATGAGKFDVATIGTYDAPIWAKNKWALPFTPLLNQLPAATRNAYGLSDIFP